MSYGGAGFNSQYLQSSLECLPGPVPKHYNYTCGNIFFKTNNGDGENSVKKSDINGEDSDKK